MVNFMFLAYFGGHICYHSNVKVELIQDFYTLVIVLINQEEQIS